MPNIQDIQAETARFYKLTKAELLGPSRFRRVARPRQVAMYLCRQYTRASLPKIADSFGGKDHTTAIHAFKTVKVRMAQNPKLCDNINKIKERLWLRDCCRSLSSGRLWSK